MANLVEQVRAAESAARAKAAEAYRQILGRFGDPRPGDAEALSRCLAALGKSPADVEADAEVLGRAAALAALAAGFSAADAARVAAGEAALASATETERIVRDRRAVDARLMGESAACAEACRRCASAAEDLRVLHEDHRALFGLPDPPAVAEAPINLVGPGRPVSGAQAPGPQGIS